jgi:hypothetical protein
MPRYFLSLRYRSNGDGLAVDEEGDDLPDPGDLREHVVDTARDLMRFARVDGIRNWHDCAFEVTDEAGQIVLTLPFADAAK